MPHYIILSLEKQIQKDPLGLMACQSREMGALQLSEEPSLRNKVRYPASALSSTSTCVMAQKHFGSSCKKKKNCSEAIAK